MKCDKCGAVHSVEYVSIDSYALEPIPLCRVCRSIEMATRPSPTPEAKADEHTYTLVVEGPYVALEVVCPYLPSDESRPCWPHDEDDIPYPAPQQSCTYESWVDGIGRDVLHGEWRFDLDAQWEWHAWDCPRLVRRDLDSPAPNPSFAVAVPPTEGNEK